MFFNNGFPEILTENVVILINNLSRAMRDKEHDGAGLKLGMRREEEIPLSDKKLCDGFKTKLAGDLLQINYHSEINLSDLHNPHFEGEIEQIISNVAEHIKKEVKLLTGDNLKLTKIGNIEIFAQSANRLRSFVQANCKYRVGNLANQLPSNQDSGLEDHYRQFREFLGIK